MTPYEQKMIKRTLARKEKQIKDCEEKILQLKGEISGLREGLECLPKERIRVNADQSITET